MKFQVDFNPTARRNEWIETPENVGLKPDPTRGGSKKGRTADLPHTSKKQGGTTCGAKPAKTDLSTH